MRVEVFSHGDHKIHIKGVNMKKALISLTDSQMETLNTEAEKLEISKSELLRRIMTTYIEGGKKVPVQEPKVGKTKKKAPKKNKPNKE